MKRRLWALALSVALLLSALCVQTPATAADADYIPNILEYGSYSSSAEFVITSYHGMVEFSSLAGTTNFKGKTLYLGCDIDMSLGNYTPFTSFSGTFDGQGYALKSIKISVTDVQAGVFGTVNGAGTVKNLGVEGGTMTLTSSSDSYRLGSIAGVNKGKIERCYSTASLTVKKGGTVTDLSVGGIAGGCITSGVIKDCYFAGYAKGVDHASGICDWGQGHNTGYIASLTNCYSIGELVATECFGLARYSASTLEENYPNAITNCYYLSQYKDVSFTDTDVSINKTDLGTGKLAYLLDGGATASTRTRVWHQGELFPELSGDKAIGTYKLTLKYTANGTSASVTAYKNAGATVSFSNITATLSSSGNVTNNVFTMPAKACTLNISTALPLINDYASNTSATEFIVVNAAGFTTLASTVNAGTDTFSGDKIYMLNCIDMSSVSHTPIGVYISDSDRSKTFQGTFYGNGNKVCGLNVNKTSLNGGGLFGTLYKAKIYDLGISYGTVKTANRAGGIAGYADASQIKNCYNLADITTTTGIDGAGGLAGVSRSTTKYTNCFNLGTVTATAGCAGGITGWGQTNVVLTNCFNMGKVTAGDGDKQGLTRYAAAGLTTIPVASYFLKASCASDYGVSKSRTQFASEELAWLLNTKGGTATNSLVFTTTPLCPAICYTASTGAKPTVKVTVNSKDSEGNIVNSATMYKNGGEMLVPPLNSTNYIANAGVAAPAKDGTKAITMKRLEKGTLNIGTAAELNSFISAVNGGNSYDGYTVKLTADIDMSAYTCKPIGTSSKPFSGIFDGCGFTVKNFNTAASNTKYSAMFGTLKGGTVKNLYLADSRIIGGYFSGAVVGNNLGGSVINCGTNATVENHYTTAEHEISVMSFNVRVNSDASPNSVSDRAPRVKQHIADYNPDIIGFQEVVPLWKSNFDSWLTGYSKEFIWRDSAGTEAAPLYWKTDKFTVLEQGSFFLSETPDVMSKGWDANYNRTCSYAALVHKASGILVLAFNTHLDNGGTEARPNGAALIASRMQALEEKYKGQGYGDNIAMYCTGDYNSKKNSTAYANMTANLADLRTDANTKLSSTSLGTYNGWGASDSLIDFIFTNNHGSESLTYKVNNEQINGYYISDHYAVYGTFALNYMHLGGLVGYNSGYVTDCFTTGTVAGGMNTGGLIGYNTGVLANSYNGNIVDSTDFMGGLIGVNKGTVTNCHYLGNSAYTAYTNNTETVPTLTETEIKTADFAATLSVGNTKWYQSEGLNSGYPFPAPLFMNKLLIIKSSSGYSRTENNYLFSVSESTDVATLASNFDNVGLIVRNNSGTEISTSAKVGTGYTVSLELNGTLIDSVTVVVKGDLSGDGAINTTDMAAMRKLLTAFAPADLQKAAADLTGDDTLNTTDLLILRKHCSGKNLIS
ncbi:MAG: hypothetical protein E7597_00940 [Ruminococcaceae bacterium]|nr:hypothetical protein [Oscillospiraceae bacterium]